MPPQKLSTNSFAGTKWTLQEDTAGEHLSGCKMLNLVKKGEEIIEAERTVREGSGEVVGISSNIGCARIGFPTRLLKLSPPLAHMTTVSAGSIKKSTSIFTPTNIFIAILFTAGGYAFLKWQKII